MNRTEIDNIRIALSSLINVESTGQNNFHIFIKKINLIHKNQNINMFVLKYNNVQTFKDIYLNVYTQNMCEYTE